MFISLACHLRLWQSSYNSYLSFVFFCAFVLSFSIVAYNVSLVTRVWVPGWKFASRTRVSLSTSNFDSVIAMLKHQVLAL
jgi:hypothetical protein